MALELLSEHGADLNVRFNRKHLVGVIFRKAGRDQFGLVQKLLAKGMTFSASDLTVLAASRYAFRHILKEFAEQLLAMESAENIKQHYSFALSACALYNWPDVAEKLFDTGIDANSLVDGRTALYVACREEHENLVRLLLAHGADPNKPNTVTLEKPEEMPTRLKSRAKLIRKSDAESLRDREV